MQKRQGMKFCYISDKYVTSVYIDEFNFYFTLMAQ